jgi:hypothetical protein
VLVDLIVNVLVEDKLCLVVEMPAIATLDTSAMARTVTTTRIFFILFPPVCDALVFY